MSSKFLYEFSLSIVFILLLNGFYQDEGYILHNAPPFQICESIQNCLQIYFNTFWFQQNEQHLFFRPFVLSRSSLRLPRTPVIAAADFGTSNFFSFTAMILSLWPTSFLCRPPSQKSSRATEEGRIRRRLVEDPTMSFTFSPSLSWSIKYT